MGAFDRARDAAWLAAAAAAQIGDATALTEIGSVASTLVERHVDGAEQLHVYTQACLEDARSGSRPPSAFERLLRRDRRGG